MKTYLLVLVCLASACDAPPAGTDAEGPAPDPAVSAPWNETAAPTGEVRDLPADLAPLYRSEDQVTWSGIGLAPEDLPGPARRDATR